MEQGEGRAEGPKVVLIVEDEHDNREIMRAVVEDLLGYKALVAGDGARALQLVDDIRPDVILMDLMMPVLDGFAAIRELKSSYATSAIPIIAVTALGRPSDKAQALQHGANAYLTKPFDLDLLAEMIERYATGGAHAGEV
ncbi:MAG: response regulator [Chloroflexota bacterium]|nr:response regulator [Chloroflexota bacterium]